MRHIISLSLFILLFVLNASSKVVEGTVYSVSINRKGQKVETPASRILISDGYSVCQTDQNGRYRMEINPKSLFITVTQPDGYRAEPFFKKIEDVQNIYDFILTKPSGGVSKSFSFGVVNFTDSVLQTNTLQHLYSVFANRNVDFVISTGKYFHSIGQGGFSNYSSLSTHERVAEYPAQYSFNWGGVHFVVLSKSDAKGLQPIQWLKSDLEASGVTIPTVIINNSVLENNNPILSLGGSALNMSDYNIKAVVEGGWNSNLFDYRGKLSASTIAVASPERGGEDYSPASVRLVSFNSKAEISVETIFTNVQPRLTLVYPTDTAVVENEKIRIYANAYSSESKVERVKAGLSVDGANFRWSELNRLSDWTWSGFLLTTNDSASRYTIRVMATTGNGEVLSDERSVFATTKSLDTTGYRALWGCLGGNAEHHNVIQNSFSGVIAHRWSVSALGSTLFSSPLAVDTIAVTASNYDLEGKSSLAAFNLKTGKSIWFYFTKGAVCNNFAYDRGTVVATDILGNIYALNVMTGKPVWTISLKLKYQSGTTRGGIIKNGIYYTAIGQMIYAIDVDSGKIIWKVESPDLDGNITTLTFGSKVILSSTKNSGFVGYDAATGRVLWSSNSAVGKISEGNSSFVGGYFHLTAGSRYCKIDPQTGAAIINLQLPFEASRSSVPLILGDTLIVGSVNNGLVACKIPEGTILWTTPVAPSILNILPLTANSRSVASSPLLVNRYIVSGASDGWIYILERGSGEIKMKVNLGTPILTTPSIARDYLIFTDFSGNLSVFKLKL